ncbi:MAG: sigma 54-interacting transcriptional regulator, partial [Spirochaetes bacterium]|nr:sigma 54-interacting transcriptional regulator [Spirochaetota bacterium]
MQIILQTLEEGIHIVDSDGRSVLYNEAMARIEGLSAEDVLGKHLLEVFPSWSASDSTLLSALSSGRTVDQRRQSYLNFNKRRITTINTTFPILSDGVILGAVEVAKNYTEVDQLSEKIMDLQQKLIDPPKARSRTPRKYTFDMLIGRHPLYMNAIGISKKAARADSNVLIEGETGTGKELFAQSIHNDSSRRDGPFVAVNCAAMPDTLLEGIFFGTAKGSYTGAEDRPGLFEQANGGTLFLDE